MSRMILPNAIIDLIYEFNPEYREQFNMVLNEFKNICFCENCGELKPVYYMDYDHEFCGSTCAHQARDGGYYRGY